MNDTVARVLKPLQKHASVVLVAGAGHYDELRALLPPDSKDFQLYPFVSEMPSLLTAADIVVTRAGATIILELAALAKPTILIPNAKLTGGHQLKNAAVYQEENAVLVVDEEQMLQNPKLLVSAVADLIEDTQKAKTMSKNLHCFAKPDAAKDMAAMILAAKK